jgi:hypothetical protein
MHWLSQLSSQQNGSLAQTWATQGSQPSASGSPTSQIGCTQVDAQSCGQLSAVSPGSQIMLPHWVPLEDELAFPPVELLLEVVEELVVEVVPPPSLPPVPPAPPLPLVVPPNSALLPQASGKAAIATSAAPARTQVEIDAMMR